MICAIYARKSNEQNGVDDSAKSVTRQIEQAKSFAAKKGWVVAEEHLYVDDGIGGAEFDAKRPGLMRLLNALKPRPPFQALLMMEEERLGREQLETGYILKQIVKAGVRVFFYLEDRERVLDTALDKAWFFLSNFAAEVEREKARQRTYDAMQRNARAGYVTGGKRFGYDNVEVFGAAGVDGKPRRSHVARQVNKTEASVVRRIFELCAEGKGYTGIAKLLNESGAPCPRPNPGRPRGWAPSSVREALFCRLYRGEIVWNQTQKRNS